MKPTLHVTRPGQLSDDELRAMAQRMYDSIKGSQDTQEAYCPTGPGGGEDNSCSSQDGSGDEEHPAMRSSSGVEDLNSVRAYRNPTPQIAKAWLQRFGPLRGMRNMSTGDTYIWPANKAWHVEVAQALGFKEGDLEPRTGQAFDRDTENRWHIQSADKLDQLFAKRKRVPIAAQTDYNQGEFEINLSEAFCPTGEGQGQDNSCPPANKGDGSTSAGDSAGSPAQNDRNTGADERGATAIFQGQKYRTTSPKARVSLDQTADLLKERGYELNPQGHTDLKTGTTTYEVTKDGRKYRVDAGTLAKFLTTEDENLPPPTKADYLQQAAANLNSLSRTAKGTVDTSSTANKAANMAANTGDEAASKAKANFASTLSQLHDERGREFNNPQDTLAFVDGIGQKINAGIVKDGVLLRNEDSPKYPYTPVAKLAQAREQFAQEFAERLKNGDPVETAAWVHWRVNFTDHFYADGCGKTSEALADYVLMRAGEQLPQNIDRDKWFAAAARDTYDPGKPESYTNNPSYRAWVSHYAFLVNPAGIPWEDGKPLKGINKTNALGVRVSDMKPEVAKAFLEAEKPYPPHDPGANDTLLRHAIGQHGVLTVFTPEREQLHQEIIDRVRKGVPPEIGQAEFVLMGGGPAAGKSSLLQQGRIALRGNTVKLNVDDDFKDRIPEYQAMLNSGDPMAAAVAHEESSILAKRAMRESFLANQNVLLDGTGDGSEKSVLKKIEEARAKGYAIRAEYVTKPIKDAAAWAAEREKEKGRAVPPTILEKTHRTIAKILPGLVEKGAFDHFRLWDTSQSEPDPDRPGKVRARLQLVASAQGKSLKIENVELWKAFLNRANQGVMEAQQMETADDLPRWRQREIIAQTHRGVTDNPFDTDQEAEFRKAIAADLAAMQERGVKIIDFENDLD